MFYLNNRDYSPVYQNDVSSFHVHPSATEVAGGKVRDLGWV